MTIKQHSDLVNELYNMLCEIVRLQGQHSPQATAMSSIYVAELMAYLGRVNNEND